MKKVSIQKKEATIVNASEGAYANLALRMDTGNRERTGLYRNIGYNETEIKDREREIENHKEYIVRLNAEVKEQKEKLEAMPATESLKPEAAKDMLLKVAALPWVEKIEIHRREDSLNITTVPGSLKTTFYRRMVVKEADDDVDDDDRYNSMVEELLEKPLELTLPQYEIYIDLSNLGGSWDQSDNLQVRIIDNPRQVHSSYLIEPLERFHEAKPHWAVGSSRGWGRLCLENYREAFQQAGKEDVLTLLNEVVIYLQTSGWAHAYKPKLRWAAELGYKEYTQNLTRMMEDGEDESSIEADNRKRLPKFLEDNGLSQHEIDFGSPAEEAKSLAERQDAQTVVNNDSIFNRVQRMLDSDDAQLIQPHGTFIFGGNLVPLSNANQAGIMPEVEPLSVDDDDDEHHF